MFGSAVGSPENDYEINEGWFTDVTSLYDPDNTFISGSPNLQPGHNPYGFIGLTTRELIMHIILWELLLLFYLPSDNCR